MKKRELVHVNDPVVYDEVFPHVQVPRIQFVGAVAEEVDGKRVFFNPADVVTRDIWISDTTFRDGQQSLPPYTPEEIAKIFGFLSRISGPLGLVRQTEFFIYTDKDREAVRRCQELSLRFPEITAWIRADEGDFQLVQNMGIRETGVLTSCSDYHIFYKMKLDRKQVVDKYLSIVKKGLEAGVRMRCHLEDVTRADIDGFVVPFVQAVMELSEQVPEELKTKIRLCDTMGFGISYPGATLPRSVPKLIYKMVHEAGVPSDRLEWHGHNDFHKVHINAATAWIYGCDICNTTLFGFGERTGNPPLEAAVFEYLSLKGHHDGIDTTAITDAAEYYTRELKIPIPSNFPFVGKNFNVTRAGIHADGLARDERIYNIFDTARILGRAPSVSISDKSGADGVALYVNTFLGLTGKSRLGKLKVAKIGRWVMDQYNEHGRTTVISDREMEEQIRTHLPDHYQEYLNRHHGHSRHN